MFKFNAFENSLRSPSKLSIKPASQLSIKPASPYATRKLKETNSLNPTLPNVRLKLVKAEVNSNQQVVSTESIFVDSGLESLTSNSSSDTVDSDPQTKLTIVKDKNQDKAVQIEVINETLLNGSTTAHVVEVIDRKPNDNDRQAGSGSDGQPVEDVASNDNDVVVKPDGIHAIYNDVTVIKHNGNQSVSELQNNAPNVTQPESLTLNNLIQSGFEPTDPSAFKPSISSGVDPVITNGDQPTGNNITAEDVLIACTEVNKTSFVLQNSDVLEINVLNNKCNIKPEEFMFEEEKDHSLVIQVPDDASGTLLPKVTSDKFQRLKPNKGKITVKVVGEILKKQNTSNNSVKVVEKVQPDGSNISEIILTNELLRKSPNVSEKRGLKKVQQNGGAAPNGGIRKVEVFRKTSEPTFLLQTRPGKLPLSRKTSHDETKTPAKHQQNATGNAKLKPLTFGKFGQLSNSEETLVKKMRSSRETVNSSSLESLQGLKSGNGEKDCSLDVWSDSLSVISDNDSMSHDKLKKNKSEEEAKSMRRRRIERNIAHKNNKNIVSANISKFQNEIEKLTAARKESVEKMKFNRTDTKEKNKLSRTDSKRESGEHKIGQTSTGVSENLLERKPSINAKNTATQLFKTVSPRSRANQNVHNIVKSVTPAQVKLWTVVTIEQALLEAETRKNGSQTYKNLSEMLKMTELLSIPTSPSDPNKDVPTIIDEHEQSSKENGVVTCKPKGDVGLSKLVSTASVQELAPSEPLEIIIAKDITENEYLKILETSVNKNTTDTLEAGTLPLDTLSQAKSEEQLQAKI
uniref:Uncharacterized protein n=1 Tax=Cacopsylla melanoneura TaxID=428564 RepID=A0A8D8WTG7_9HEMI